MILLWIGRFSFTSYWFVFASVDKLLIIGDNNFLIPQ